MREPLDVLLIESHPGVGDASARVLAEAGHRVHRCHDAGDPSWVCVGLADPSACPLEGHVDVAVLARAPGSTGPTPHEDGVRCAIRSRVPIVEVGLGARETDPVDGYAPWVTLHSHEAALDAACHAAVTLGNQRIVDAVLERVVPLVAEAGLPPERTHATISSHWPGLTLTVTIPGPADRRLEQAIGVRAYDALRLHTDGYSTVDVNVDVENPDRLLV